MKKRLLALVLALICLIDVYPLPVLALEIADASSIVETADETLPEETTPEETLPEQTEPDETVPEETTPEETVPEETVPEETVPEETVPEETQPEEELPAYSYAVDDGVLTVSGTEVPDFTEENPAPWNIQDEEITHVYVEETVTSLGENALTGLTHITEVSIPASVEFDPAADLTVPEVEGSTGAWVKDEANSTEDRTVYILTYTEVPSTALAAPVVTASNSASSGKVKLAWEAVEGAVKYKVYRSESKDGSYSLMYNTDGTTYTNSSATPGVRYYYYVVAVAEDGSLSERSNIVERLCVLARPVVTASNVASTGKVRLTWEAVEGAVKYKVYRAESKDGSYSLMYTADGTTYTNSSSEVGITYYYKVKAIAEDPDANSALSAAKSRTRDLPRPVVTATNNTATGKVKLTWDLVDGAVSYKVYRAESKDGEYSLMYTTEGNTYTNSSGVAGTTYYYKVRAIAEVSKASSAYSAIKSRTCDCPQPTITQRTNASGKPSLTWEPVEGAVKYKVYRAESKDGDYSVMYTTEGNTYSNTKAEIGTTYYYKVKAFSENSYANSVYSNIVTGKAIENVYQYTYAKYTTTKSGSANRNTNLTLSCKAINDTILAPGEEFSFNEVVGPRTEAKGYQLATVFNDAGVGRGGGVCQVATTLFNSALLGNLEITKRYQHSQAVTYVPLGRDATIYKKQKDICFRNDSDYYIKIKASSSNGTVVISFLTREKGVAPGDDVKLTVTKKGDTYTLKRSYKGTVNYTVKSTY